jgi:hypothetical protein
MVGDIQVHIDFIERNHDLDYFACFSNTQLTKYKKWEVKSPKATFKVWFTNMNGEPIEVKTKAEEEVKRRREEMLKQYEEDMKKKGLSEPAVDNSPVVAPESAQATFVEDSEEPEEETQSMYISSFVLELMLIY